MDKISVILTVFSIKNYFDVIQITLHICEAFFHLFFSERSNFLKVQQKNVMLTIHQLLICFNIFPESNFWNSINHYTLKHKYLLKRITSPKY